MKTVFHGLFVQNPFTERERSVESGRAQVTESGAIVESAGARDGEPTAFPEGIGAATNRSPGWKRRGRARVGRKTRGASSPRADKKKASRQIGTPFRAGKPETSGHPELQSAYSSKSISNNSSHGRPPLLSSAMNGSGSNCSTLNTPGCFHKPLQNIIAPMVAGTPVV